MTILEINKAIGFEEGYNPFKQTILEPGEYLIIQDTEQVPHFLNLVDIEKIENTPEGDEAHLYLKLKDGEEEDDRVIVCIDKYGIREAYSIKVI